MATMQKQMEEFQKKLLERPQTILLPSSHESTIVGEPRGSRPGGQVTFGSTDDATGEPGGSRGKNHLILHGTLLQESREDLALVGRKLTLIAPAEPWKKKQKKC